MRRSALSFSVTGGFILLGLAIMGASAYWGWQTAQKATTAAAWPTVPAYVIDSKIEWATVRASSTRRRRSGTTHFYRLAVLAGYRVNGAYYTSSTPAVNDISEYKLSPHPETHPADREMVALFKQVPQGTVVPIHYNPADPSEAYIFTDPFSWKLYPTNVAFFLFGTLPFLFGLAVFILNRRW